MKTNPGSPVPDIEDAEWVAFPGGELEGRRPKVLCAGCRERLQRAIASQQPVRPGGRYRSAPPSASSRTAERPGPQAPLCFACYRAEMARELALRAAGALDTASEARFQSLLPLEPVDRARLARLRAERSVARVEDASGGGRFVDRRRRAQIAARHALQHIRAGLRFRNGSGRMTEREPGNAGRENTPAAIEGNLLASRSRLTADARLEWAAVHAAELQLPEAWVPFVVSR
jgi:hypothetical protein